MKKWSKIVPAMLLWGLFFSFTLQAQAKPTLTILPFTGLAGGEEEAITSLLSRQEDLHKSFTLVPCTSTFNDLVGDIEFESYTNEADLMREVKSRLNAEFAVVVWAEKVGPRNLVLLSLVKVENLQQLGGDYRSYTSIRDIRTVLPDIAKKIIEAANQKQEDLPKFSVLPFYSGTPVRRDADLLFQIMNIELANSKKYALFPWALIMDSLINDRNIPYYYGIVDPGSIYGFGQDSQVQYVLTGDILNQGSSNLFMASIIGTQDAEFLTGGDIEYRTITEDLNLITALSQELIGGESALAAVTPGVENPPEPNPVMGNPPPPTLSGPAVTPPPQVPGAPVQKSSKPTLTILPYSGQTGGDEETITILLANQEELRNVFNVTPCTTNFDRLLRDLGSQSYKNREEITAALQKQLPADFTLIVRAESVGTSHISLISLIDMETLQLVSGNYQKYSAVRDLRGLLPAIAKETADASQLTADPSLPKLTVLPFYTPSGVDFRDADILFQYLTIELANSGKYVVYPWALPIETLVTDLKIPYFGIVDPKSLNAFGTTSGIRFVLTGDLLNLGTTNLFMSSIVKTGDGNVLYGGDLEYRILMEDQRLLGILAQILIHGKPLANSKDPWAVAETPVVSTPLPPRLPAVEPVKKDPLDQFVKISGGGFIMGTPLNEAARDNDEIQHQVQVPGFYMGKYEVTQEEYEALMGTNPSFFKRPNQPVEQVSWYQAAAYCNARSIKEGLTPVYVINGMDVTWNRQANGYRLPTEEEWEYACRAGTTGTFYTGDNFTSSDGNFDGTYTYNRNTPGLYRERTTPVGSFNPNPWGLYDMHGNVYEWCWDQYAPYNNRSAFLSNKRVARGGSWYSALRYLRSGNRVQFSADVEVYYVGFRLARNL